MITSFDSFIGPLQIEERCAELILSDEQLRDVCDRMLVEINRGLNKETNKEATVKCFPTYVRELPNGEGKHIYPIDGPFG